MTLRPCVRRALMTATATLAVIAATLPTAHAGKASTRDGTGDVWATVASDDPGPHPAPEAELNVDLLGASVAYSKRIVVRVRYVDLGQQVTKGQPIADLIALDGPEAFIARTPILAGTDGLVLTRSLRKYVARGEGIAKIVGTTPLPQRRGYLLED